LRRYLADARRLGPAEKRAVSHAFFAYFRWLEWLDRRDSAQKQVAAALALHERFAQNPASVKPETLAARAIPAWASDEVDFPLETLRQLQRDPVLWLRARPGQAAQLAASLGHCTLAAEHLASLVSGDSPAAHFAFPVPGAALLYTGGQDLFRTPQFHNGLFEIQDLASQLVGLACAPRPGQTWWDACAGEGGKALHLADLMGNKGLLWASDRSHRRLQLLRRRAARAQIYNYRGAHWDGSARLPTKTRFDGVLVDAPCSGLGTWQRNPHARWTTTPRDVAELAGIQQNLLNRVAPSIKAGGRLLYAVCTLTRGETVAVANAFTAAHPEFEPAPVFAESGEHRLTLWPHALNANGMFIAAWRRK
ncbi:MAG: RsmB/NOP family class I SAM-dependent RNA methyltransferase, partial [Opitutaceae bacterium]|nr:RsmB/NOP family class I SAM-dependent RNA methyltransferase [Opitutaceae bacterium]